MSEIIIREYNNEDAEIFAEIHYDAVHNSAKGFYSQDILDQWSCGATPERVSHIRKTAHLEIRRMAEIDGEVVGLGVVVPEKHLLGACYVRNAFNNQGIGRAIVRDLEEIAKQYGVKYLEMDASLNAEQFYNAVGYKTIAKGEHIMRSGEVMACVKMKKVF